MRRYEHESCGVQREIYAIHGAIARIGQAVNRGRERGRVKWEGLSHFWRPGGHVRASLEGQPYQWEEAAPSATFRTWREAVAALGVCWWVDGTGDLHYRVVGEAIRAGTCRETRRECRPWGLSEAALYRVAPLALVYPELWIEPYACRQKTVGWSLTRHLAVYPGDRDSWYVLNGWCEDTGDDAGALHAAAALRRLDGLAECFGQGNVGV